MLLWKLQTKFVAGPITAKIAYDPGENINRTEHLLWHNFEAAAAKRTPVIGWQRIQARAMRKACISLPHNLKQYLIL